MNYENVTINLNAWNACRTNTAMAQTNGYHFDLEKLIAISAGGGNKPLAELVIDLDYYAKKGDSDGAVERIRGFAQAILSAYQIQESSYKEHPEE